MARKPRIHYPGAVYHVIARGVDRRIIFNDDKDFESFLSALNRITVQLNARVLAYCLMTNHIHLAIKVGNAPLSKAMHRILTSYAQTFNLRNERVGHLFQGRHRAFLCPDESRLFYLVRYIHQNPVRAGLVRRPRDWPWSSARSMGDPSDEDALPADFDPWFGAGREEEPVLLRSENPPIPELDEIGRAVAMSTGFDLREIRSKTKRADIMDAKRELSRRAVTSGYSMQEIAIWLGVSVSRVGRYLKNRRNGKA